MHVYFLYSFCFILLLVLPRFCEMKLYIMLTKHYSIKRWLLDTK